MSRNIGIVKDHEGAMHLTVAGAVAIGAKVTSISTMADGEMAVVVVIPLRDVALSEQDNILPFKRAA